MLKDYFLNKVENAINEAVKAQKLGQMSEYTKGSLVVEKPKNPDFGDLAINVSSLARSARIAPPMIANSIVEFIDKKDCEYSVIGGFINAFVLLPTYAAAFGMPIDALVGMGTAVNSHITNLTTFVLFAVVPFNIVKGVLVSVVVFLIYKKISPIFRMH